jgi:hypothetical protein
LGGKVWFDKNRDGVKDSDDNEPGIKGVIIELYNKDGQKLMETVSADDGSYLFNNIQHGNYKVKVVTSNYIATTKSNDSVINPDSNESDTITLEEADENNDTNIGLSVSTISGKVYDDGNKDGVVNGDAIADADGQLYVILLKENQKIASKEVNSSGEFSFGADDNVTPNSLYTVVLANSQDAQQPTLASNWEFTEEAIDNNKDSTTDGKIDINLTNEDISNIAFGINKAPLATNDSAQVDEDNSTVIDILANDSDKENNLDNTTITITKQPQHGSVEVVNGKVKYTPNSGYSGSDSFKYTVKDKVGATSNEAVVDITVNNVNDAPEVKNNIDNKNYQDGDDVELNVSENFEDPDGDDLEFTATGLPAGLTIDKTTGKITGKIDKNASQSGPYEVTITAKDPSGEEVTTTFKINVTNPLPTANNDSETTNEDTPITIDVINNDSDIDGDALTIKSSSLTQPSNGKVEIKDGKIIYTPNENFNGTDTFTYKVVDADNGESNEATVTVTVNSVNDLPIANDDNQTLEEDTVATIDIANNDSDIDGTLDLTSIVITEQPKHGKVKIVDGKVKYTPDLDYFGEDSFKYTIADNEGGVSNEATVNLTITDVADFTTIDSFVWIDDNGNEKFDKDERPLTNVKVELLDMNGNVVSKEQRLLRAIGASSNQFVGTTNSNGEFKFEKVPFGNYKLRFTLGDKAIADGYNFIDDNGKKTTTLTTSSVDATDIVKKSVSVAVAVECDCDNVKSDGGDALSTLAILFMIFATMGMALGANRQKRLQR